MGHSKWVIEGHLQRCGGLRKATGREQLGAAHAPRPGLRQPGQGALKMSVGLSGNRGAWEMWKAVLDAKGPGTALPRPSDLIPQQFSDSDSANTWPHRPRKVKALGRRHPAGRGWAEGRTQRPHASGPPRAQCVTSGHFIVMVLRQLNY